MTLTKQLATNTRTRMATYQDVMQVCMNGHVITDRYNTSPEFRKNFCTQCESKTITTCQQCNTPIPGDLIFDSLVVMMGPGPVAPKICDNCGNRFPWYEQRKRSDEEYVEANKREAEEKKLEKRLASLKKFEVKVEGHGNVVSLGSVIDSVIANTVKLTSTGDEQVATALAELTKAITASSDVTADKKAEYLQQLDTLSTEALKPVEQRLPRSVLKPIINAGLGTLSKVADLAQVWGTWGKEITTFFLGAL